MAEATPAGAKPTLEEAVGFILKSATVEYRRDCLAHWRLQYGDAFADQVEARVRAEWKRK